MRNINLSLLLLVSLLFFVMACQPEDDIQISQDAESVTAQKEIATESSWDDLPETIVDEEGNEYVLILPGSFIMGNNDGDEKEAPEHKVNITKPFYFGRYEVSQLHYSNIMGVNNSKTQGDELPITNVSWNDVEQFCLLFSAVENKTVRMPTEAEWEYVYKAGTDTEFYWGDDYDQESLSQPNPWGIYDMAGSVREYCLDWANPYPQGDVTDPDGGAESDRLKVIRGGYGSSLSSHGYSATSRGFADPLHSFYDNIGIRLVIEVD